MEIIWHILLTVCLDSECRSQDVQWFETQKDCEINLGLYKQIPPDGNWDTVEYVCKPIGSEQT